MRGRAQIKGRFRTDKRARVQQGQEQPRCRQYMLVSRRRYRRPLPWKMDRVVVQVRRTAFKFSLDQFNRRPRFEQVRFEFGPRVTCTGCNRVVVRKYGQELLDWLLKNAEVVGLRCFLMSTGVRAAYLTHTIEDRPLKPKRKPNCTQEV